MMRHAKAQAYARAPSRSIVELPPARLELVAVAPPRGAAERAAYEGLKTRSSTAVIIACGERRTASDGGCGCEWHAAICSRAMP